jgi:hypothetical protein
MKKTSHSRWAIAFLGLFAILPGARAADPVQTITLKVPVEIDWPQADVNQAFVKGPPFLRCEIHQGIAPDNPDSGQWLALGFDKPLASASQPLMVDASGHFSGNVSLSFSVSASIAKLTYWCYLAATDTRANYLDSLATGRGLKLQTDQASAWKNINK